MKCTKRHFPVSESSFKELVKKEQGEYLYHFVDKTLFIRDILENPRRVSLITRPRRFGKSTNFNMLAWFLDIRKKEESKELFSGLKLKTPNSVMANLAWIIVGNILLFT